MASSLNAGVDSVWQALVLPGYAVEETVEGAFSVRVAERNDRAVDVWVEEDWVRVRCVVTQAASVSDDRLAELLRANRHLKRIRVGLDDDGQVVLRADYPLFLWSEDDFRAVVATMFVDVERVYAVTRGEASWT